MKPDRLLQHFDQLAEAPDAVPRLRRFILDLAVRGKLVEQDPADEPAMELLRGIQQENACLAREGKVTASHLSSPVSQSEIPFEIPETWRWVRVAQVADTRLGKMLDKAKNSGIERRYLRNVNVRWFDFDLSDLFEMKLKDSELDEFSLRNGDVLICEGGEPGRSAVWDKRETGIYFQKAIHRVRFLGPIVPLYFVRALYQAASSGRLEQFFTGVTIKHFTGKGLARYTFPLPPLAEQHRIVAKVDELMALCNELEAAQAKRERRRDRLVATALHSLNNGDASADPGALPTFQDSAHFYFNHLPRLTTCPEHIHQLRQTILNLAVRGRLVEQDLNDEPASALLDRIRFEKNRLASAGNWNKQKGAGLLGDCALIFEVPESWEWTTYRELAIDFRYGTSKKCSYERKGQPVLRIPNVSGGKITTEVLKFTKLTQSESEALSLSVGDVLMVRSNGSLNLVGRPALVEEHVKGFCYAGYLVRVRFVPETVDSRYLIVVMNSRLVRDQIEIPIRTAVGLKNVNSTELGNLRIPLPPLTEQHRIVAKVDELMALCDDLGVRLTTTATTRRRLLEVTLHEALGVTYG